jgi:uncharacterized membrane protein YecN with MAPEG domain
MRFSVVEYLAVSVALLAWLFFSDGKPWWVKPVGIIMIIGTDRLLPVFIKRKENQT